MSYQGRESSEKIAVPMPPLAQPEGLAKDFPAQQDPANPPQVGPAVTRDAPEGRLDDVADSLEEQERAAAYVEELVKTKRS